MTGGRLAQGAVQGDQVAGGGMGIEMGEATELSDHSLEQGLDGLVLLQVGSVAGEPVLERLKVVGRRLGGA
jgi:hypothetical protein